jgi:hypothetical protein
MSHAPPPQALPHGWIACHTSDGQPYYFNQLTDTSSWHLPSATPPPQSASPPPPTPPPSAPSAPAADAFDISGTSVASLQNFLEPTPDFTCRQALFFLLPHCHGLAPKKLDEMLVANGWEVEQVQVAGLADYELKLAVRMFTVEQPYPLYRSFNNPFFDKNRSPQLLQHHAAYCHLLLCSHVQNM